MSLRIHNLTRCPQWLDLVSGWLHGEWHGLTKVSLAERKQRLTQHLSPDLTPSTWLALADTQPMGTVSLVRYDLNGDNGYWLANLFVMPEYRGQGYGAALCSHLDKVCQRAGIEQLRLFTTDKQHFYHRQHWQHQAQARVLGQEVSIMSKRVPSVGTERPLVTPSGARAIRFGCER